MSAQADKWQEKVSPLLRQQVAKHRMEARAATRGEQPENYLGALVKTGRRTGWQRPAP